MSPRMAKTIAVVTSDTQLATNSFCRFMAAQAYRIPVRQFTTRTDAWADGQIRNRPFAQLPETRPFLADPGRRPNCSGTGRGPALVSGEDCDPGRRCVLDYGRKDIHGPRRHRVRAGHPGCVRLLRRI